MRGAHDIIYRRIGQDESAGDRDQQGPVHYRARAVAIGQMAAIGAEQARGKRKHGRRHAGRFEIYVVDLHQILRQPKRKRDKAAEDEEIIQREAPDLNILQRLHFQPGARGLGAGAAALRHHRVFPGREPEDHGHDRQTRGPDVRDALPAHRDHDKGRAEFGDRGADIAGAKNAQRRSLLARLVPARHIGDADGKGPARHADAERG